MHLTDHEYRTILTALRAHSATEADAGRSSDSFNALIGKFHAAITKPVTAFDDDDASGLYVQPMWADSLAGAPLWRRTSAGSWWHGDRSYPESVVPSDLLKLGVEQ